MGGRTLRNRRRKLIECVDEQAGDLSSTLIDLATMPAFGTTGKGYPEIVAFLGSALSDAGLSVDTVEIPTEYLRKHWGENLERSAQYIPVCEPVPRAIVLGQLGESRSCERNLHLTQHYDLPNTRESVARVSSFNGCVSAPGVSTCRAGILAILVAVRAVTLTRLELIGNLFVSFTPDNHLGGETGAGYLVHKGYGKSGLVITGSESGPDTLVLGYKGAAWIRITTYGRPAGASTPHLGINAIDKMANIQRALSVIATQTKRSSRLPIVPPEAMRSSIVCSKIESSGWGVPTKCVMFIDRRIGPDETVQDVLREIEETIEILRTQDKDLRADVDMVHAVEAATTDPGAALAVTLSENIRRVLGVEPKNAVLPYYTEFRVFAHEWNAQVVNYSPGRLSHVVGDPERVRVSDVISAAKVLAFTIADLLTADMNS
jgi:succinyl-diaminopimelate desuccinylase